MNDTTIAPGTIIREWRKKRRMSQLDLALEAEISQRHLSFLENGRSRPSRDMALAISERLDMPLRQRNRLLAAAGFVPSYSERPLDSETLRPAIETVQAVLKAHEPNPAIAVDRHWNMVLGNSAVPIFLAAIQDKSLLEPPVNILRLSLHPGGLAPLVVNFDELRAHLLDHLSRLNDLYADEELHALEEELRGYPGGSGRHPAPKPDQIAIPLMLRVGGQTLSFLSTITVFGTPRDVTLSELAIETFFPVDDVTRAFVAAAAKAATT
ncbi:MAG: helix-turn-helix transcriptional regulator [Rhizobiaceae bacterium]|nr:helix-turn-helix transcriptional regulator [Rhizobiaceae bacterium]